MATRWRALSGAAPGDSASRSAPRPTCPRQIRPRAGAASTPATGVSFSISAMLTVNSSRPARNSRVPSSGSTMRKRPPSPSTGRLPVASSDTTGTPGMSLASPARMTVSEASSAAVTGEESGLRRWFRSICGTARIAAAAREAISVRPSSSPAISDSVVTKAPFRFNRLRFITSPAHARRPNRLNVPKNVQVVFSIKSSLAFGGRMSGAIALEGLDLAALLCSRVCHDLISPVGAIANGLEVMEEGKDEETNKFAMDLIKKSARTASAKLQFCRIAFGAAGSAGAQIDTGDAEKVTRGLLEDEKTKLAWNLPRVLMAKNRVKLLLNMMLMAAQAIPRGGQITVAPVGEGDAMGFRVSVTGQNAKVPASIPPLLAGQPNGHAVDAHAIQPFYTGLLAKNCRLSVAMAAEGETVVITAK